MKTKILGNIFAAANLVLLLGVILGYPEFSWVDDVFSAVLLVLLLGCIFAMTGLKNTFLRKWATAAFLVSLGFLVSRPLLSVPYWWNAVSTVVIMAAILIIGLTVFGISFVLRPADRDESTHNFLFMMMTGTLLVALIASFATATLSGNSTLELFSTFTTLFSLLVLGIGWLRFAPYLNVRFVGVLRTSCTTFLVVLVIIGIVRTVVVSTAYADAVDALNNNNIPRAKNIFLQVAGNKKRADLQDKSIFELAKIALAEGRLDEAIGYLSKVEGVPEKELRAVKEQIAMKLLDEARTCQKKNMIKETEFYVNKAVKLAPFSAKALTGGGGILASLEKIKSALRLFEQASKINRAFKDAWQGQLDILLEMGRDADAARIVVQFPQVKVRDDARVRVGRMLVMMEGGSFTRAKAVLLPLKRKGGAEAAYWLARACDALGGFREARPLYEKAGKDKKFADGLYRIGVHLEAQGTKGEALALYKSVVEKTPDHAGAMQGKARLLKEQNPFGDFRKFKLDETLHLEGWCKITPPTYKVKTGSSLKSQIRVLNLGQNVNTTIKLLLESTIQCKRYYYVLDVGRLEQNIPIGCFTSFENAFELPLLPPRKYELKLAVAKDTAGLGSITVTGDQEYTRKEVTKNDMVGTTWPDRKKLIASPGSREFRLYVNGWVVFPLYTMKGRNTLVLKLEGREAKGETSEFSVLVEEKQIYRGHVKTLDIHEVKLPFDSGGGIKWFYVNFLNDYYKRDAQGKLANRDLFIYSAKVLNE